MPPPDVGPSTHRAPKPIMPPPTRTRAARVSPLLRRGCLLALFTLSCLTSLTATRADDDDPPAHSSSESDEWFDDVVEEYVIDSPRDIDRFMQQAMREAREAPGYVKDPKVNDIFPGGPVHTRALGIARERGEMRSPPVVIPPSLAGRETNDDDDDDDEGGRALPPHGMKTDLGSTASATSAGTTVAGNATSSFMGEDARGEEDAPTAASASEEHARGGSGSAWGSGDVLGGLLVMDGDAEARHVARDGESAASAATAGGAALDADDASTAALTPMDRARRGAQVGAAIATGAIANSGALPKPEDWASAAHEDLSPSDVAWLVAQDTAETSARARRRQLSRRARSGASTSSDTALAAVDDESAKTEELYAKMIEWFESKGGRLEGVNVSVVAGKPGDGRGLKATSRLAPHARIIRVPVSLTLSQVSARNLRVQGGQVGEQLKPLFSSDPERALAVLLLHEHLKEHLGDGSKWGPYIRTLGHPALGKPVLEALAGTYASELHYARQAEAMKTYQELSQGVCVRAQTLCQRHPGRHQAGSFTRDDLRWAMGVVRSRAVWVTRRTTGATFLALVPFLDLMPHHPEAGGEATLELDNSISVAVTKRALAGAELAVNRGNVTDAESFLRWHQVTPGFNPGNGVRLQLPGAEVEGADIIKKVELLRRWRKEMAMPPRGADLWRGASALGLYGDSDEELEAIRAANSPSKMNGRGSGIAALGPNGEGGITVEEELMLTGQAKSPEAAALAAAKYVGLPAVPFSKKGPHGGGDFMLYSAPDPDEPGGDDPYLEHSRKELAKLAIQTQAAAAFGESSETPGGEKEEGDEKTRSDGGDAAAKALSASRDFFERGVPPPRGLDDLDLFLLRKGHLMSKCGKPEDFLIHANGPSDALMCSTRVLLANETEVKALEGGGPDPHWNGQRDETGYQFSEAVSRGEVHEPFDPKRPLSFANERAALKRLAMAATNILMAYPTTEEEDLDLLLEDPDVPEDDENELDAEWEKAAAAAATAAWNDEESSVRDGDEFEALEASVDAEVDAAEADLSSIEAGVRRHMPRSIRVMGGLRQSAVAMRLREKRLLKSAMRWMMQREATLDGLEYQVDEKERERLAREARVIERRERAVDVVVPEEQAANNIATTRKAALTVKEGDVLDDVVRAFMSEHSLLDSAFGILVDALKRELRPRPRLLAAVPIIVPAGRKGVLAVREGDNVTELTQTFADLHEIPDGIVPGLTDKVNETLVKRAARRLLLSMPVSAPDGRTLQLEVREGEQHDLMRFVAEWNLAERLPSDTVEQIANAAFARLGNVLVAMPVDVPGRVRLMLHARSRDTEAVRVMVEAFCEVNDLGSDAVLPLVRGLLSRLNPGSILINANPPGKQEDATNEDKGEDEPTGAS